MCTWITGCAKPELIVVALVLYFVGIWIKQNEVVKDRHTPLANGDLGIAVCGIYVPITSTCRSGQEILMAIFTVVTQGILLAGLSTHINQIIKQVGRGE